MKFLNKLSKKFSLIALALFAVTLIATTGTVEARTQYQNNGTTTTATPVFNDFYDVPNAVGDEADFVRVKPKTGGNGDYVNSLAAACNIGDVYSVRTYIHNGASPDYNNNGSGSAVAHNVMVALKAELGSAQSKFKFTSTVSASNAASVTDSGYLDCGSKTLKLSLVPTSVQTYSKPIGFNTESDSVVNGAPFKVGSRSHASGDQWGCWEDRIIVTFEVKIEEVPVVIPSSAICKLENTAFVVVDDKKRIVKGGIKPVLSNATVESYSINWGDGTASTKQSDTHTYAKDGQYNIQASFVARFNDGSTKTISGSDCATVVKFEQGKPPVVVTPTTPTHLAKTGAANIFSIFAITSVIGAVLHRIYTVRKATQEA